MDGARKASDELRAIEPDGSATGASDGMARSRGGRGPGGAPGRAGPHGGAGDGVDRDPHGAGEGRVRARLAQEQPGVLAAVAAALVLVLLVRRLGA